MRERRVLAVGGAAALAAAIDVLASKADAAPEIRIERAERIPDPWDFKVEALRTPRVKDWQQREKQRGRRGRR